MQGHQTHYFSVTTTLWLLLLVIYCRHPVAAQYGISDTFMVSKSDAQRLDKLLTYIEVAANKKTPSGVSPQAQTSSIASNFRVDLASLLKSSSTVKSTGNATNAGTGVQAMSLADPAVATVFSRNLAVFLTSPEAASIMRQGARAVERIYNVPTRRETICKTAKTMNGISSETQSCFCDPIEPWPYCVSRAYLEIVPQMNKKFRALNPKKGAGIRPQKFSCDVPSIIAGISNGLKGCLSAGCSYPIPPVYIVAVNIEGTVCVPYLDVAPGQIRFCSEGKCEPLVNYSNGQLTYDLTLPLRQYAEMRFGLSVGLCLNLGGIEDVLELIGLDTCALKGSLDVYPLKTQLSGKLEMKAWWWGIGVEGTLQMGNGGSNPVCSLVRSIGGSTLYSQTMQCRNYCAWNAGQGEFGFFAWIWYLFGTKRWNIPIASSGSVPECLPPSPPPNFPQDGYISLRGGRSGQLCADEFGRIICNRNAVGAWEKFRVQRQSNGRFTLRGGHSFKYCADDSDGMRCNRDGAYAWEHFLVEPLGGNTIALRGGRANAYCADESGKVICNRGAVGPWERFTFAAA